MGERYGDIKKQRRREAVWAPPIATVLLLGLFSWGAYRSAAVASEVQGPEPVGSSDALTPQLIRVAEVLGLPVLRPVGLVELGPSDLVLKTRESLRRHSPPSSLGNRDAVLKMFGLIAHSDLLSAVLFTKYPEQVSGFMAPREDSILVRSDLSASDREELLLHQYVHTLQDQHFDLEGILAEAAGDDDRARAIRAILEGQAVMVASRLCGTERETIRAHRLGTSPASTPEVLALLRADAPAVGPEVLKDGGSRLVQSGVSFLRWFEEKYGSGSAAFYALPGSTEQVIHFDRYLAREKPERVSLAALRLTVGPRWDRVDEQTLGELNIAFWLGEHPGGTASSGWGGDRLAGFRSSDGMIMTAFRTVWDSEQDAIEFQEAARGRIRFRFPGASLVRQIPGGFLLVANQQAHGVIRLGTEVRIVNGAFPDEIESLLTALW